MKKKKVSVSPATDGVRAVAEMIGPLQPNIYGDTFDVVRAFDPPSLQTLLSDTFVRARRLRPSLSSVPPE